MRLCCRLPSRAEAGGFGDQEAAQRQGVRADRFTDDEIPLPDGLLAAELRAFYSAWRSELTR